MKRSLLVVLLLGLVFAAVVRAQDEEASGGGSGGEEAPKPKPKPKPAAKKPAAKKPAAPKNKGGAPYSADIPLEALSKLPVEPLSMDAAALKDDDRQFDQLPKQLNGNENVEQLTESLKKASSLLTKMKRDVEAEKVWTKNVYDIIQNYQYKYLKTVKDVKMRSKKVRKMAHLVKLLKQSTLHSAVERELSKASKALGELVTRAGEGGVAYTKVTQRMHKLKTALSTMPRPRQLFSDTTDKMKKVLRSRLPPKTSDALEHLVSKKPWKKSKKSAPKAAAKPTAAAKPAPKKSSKAKKSKAAKGSKKAKKAKAADA